MAHAIGFEIPNAWGNDLVHILKPLDIADYNWYVSSTEAYFDDFQELFPRSEALSGCEMLELLCKEKCYGNTAQNYVAERV